MVELDVKLRAATRRSVDHALESDRVLKNANWWSREPASESDKGADNQREANQSWPNPECQ